MTKGKLYILNIPKTILKKIFLPFYFLNIDLDISVMVDDFDLKFSMNVLEVLLEGTAS